MNIEKLVGLLEEHIKEISNMNELLSRRLAHLVETPDLQNLQNLILERECQAWDKNHEMEMQLMDVRMPNGMYYGSVPYKIKPIILKFHDLKKPFRLFNTLEFLLSLDSELKSANDDLPEKINELSSFKIEPFLIQNSIASYLESLIHIYIKLNQSRNDKNAVRHGFKILQLEAQNFIDNTTAMFENPLNKDLNYQFHTFYKKTFLEFIAINLETSEQS